MVDLDYVKQLAEGDHHLAVLATARTDRSVHASVVSAGVIDDPVDGSPSIGLVAIGNSRKLLLLRLSGEATIVFKDGFQWAAVSGPVRLVGSRGRTRIRAQCARHHPGGLPGGAAATMRTGPSLIGSWPKIGAVRCLSRLRRSRRTPASAEARVVSRAPRGRALRLRMCSAGMTAANGGLSIVE